MSLHKAFRIRVQGYTLTLHVKNGALWKNIKFNLVGNSDEKYNFLLTILETKKI
jgi:hypothetical protein